jgi:hypothetical protein
MYSLDTLARLFITIAILSQLFHLRKSKQVYSPAFFLYSFGSYMMAYDYYRMDGRYSTRVMFKLFNSTMLLLIALMSR